MRGVGFITSALALCAALAGSGCSGATIYFRGTPKQVDTEVRTGPTVVSVDVEQTTTNEIYAVVFEHTDMEVTRVLVYNTVTGVAEHKWYWEFVEIPLGVVWLGPALLCIPVLATLPESPSQKYKQPQSTVALVFGPINPAQSAFFVDWVTYYDRDEYVFKTAPKQASFTKGRPLAGAQVAYAWQDTVGNIVAQGRGATDPFGRVPIAPAPTGSERLFVRLGDGPPVEIPAPAIVPAGEPPAIPPPTDPAARPAFE